MVASAQAVGAIAEMRAAPVPEPIGDERAPNDLKLDAQRATQSPHVDLRAAGGNTLVRVDAGSANLQGDGRSWQSVHPRVLPEYGDDRFMRIDPFPIEDVAEGGREAAFVEGHDG